MRSCKLRRFRDARADVVPRKHPKDRLDVGIRHANSGIDIDGQTRHSPRDDRHALDERERGAELAA
ncbi:MAG TPA: hypothetical protein VLK65_11700 [Vicinamibacteria bacterium]|nr:hypothetical protein [Vicinamibacteria bacterium]